MSRNNIIASLDIGSHAIRVAVGQWVHAVGRDQLHVVGAIEMPSDGISRGVVTSIDDAVSSVSSALERAEKVIGVPIERVILGISGNGILSDESRGVVGISRSDGEITEADVERAIEAARTFATPSNYDILHVVPKSFTVDGETNIKDPVGMHGIRLEVNAYIIQGLSSQIKNLTKCVYRTGIEIDDLVLGTLATAEGILTNRAKELGGALVNIGASNTSVIIYEGGDMLYTGTIPIGGEHITSDIAIGLRTSFEIAESVKVRHGFATPRDMSKKTEINLRDLGGLDDEYVSLRYVSEIIEARVEEIFVGVDQILKKIGKSGMLPSGVALTGGTSKLPGIVDVAKKKLRLPVSFGYPLGVSSASDKINDAAFVTVFGLLKWGADSRKGREATLGDFFTKVSSFKNVTKNMKGLFGLFGK